MGIKEFINERPGVVIPLVIAAILIALVVSVRSIRSHAA